MKQIIRAIVVVIIIYLSSLAAATYYADPDSGSMEGDGSAASPLGKLQDVLLSKNLAGGYTVLLRSGYHGTVVISGVNDTPVVITRQPGHTPGIRSVSFKGATNWVLEDVTVTPDAGPGFVRGLTLVSLDRESRHNRVKACSLYSVTDAGAWTKEEWWDLPSNGMGVSGDSNTISGNLVLNVKYGISVTGKYNLMERNEVCNFSGDGLRGLASHCVFQYNTVKNCYKVNSHHDDGFQSWTSGEFGVGSGVINNVVLSGNTIINYDDPDQPFRGTLQGIGCFDGFFEGWRVENNLIITDHWHGIAFYGARNCTIANNTAVDLNDQVPGPPWIHVFDHKDGTLSTGNTLRNNIGGDLPDSGDCVKDHNISIASPEYYRFYFTDPGNLDFRLREGSPGIDAGSNELAPVTDLDGKNRPLNGTVDIGAYEYGVSGIIQDGLRMPNVERRMTKLPNPTTFPTIWNQREKIRVFNTGGNEMLPGKQGEAGIYFLKTEAEIKAVVITKQPSHKRRRDENDQR